ncbi:SRPBCC family protein [Luteimonas marina]|uniref:SRPBCC family protein n=1 Tax=Luteimonas marina TaxID=488485 RepID=A0A5C5TZB3_9GAMM|nr:SRPBCC family protein [Luteimonas marina]TWT19403.1 SRPBCC family protein [Luteimonas marina]
MSDTQGPGSVRLHRVLRAPPERVYRAFLDPGALVKWLPPHGFTGTMHEMDARVGGGYRMSFTNLGTGSSHSFTVKYVELVPNERIRHTDTFDAPGLPGEMQVTVTLKQSIAGTELQIVQAGIPAAIPVDYCHQGWQESLELLAKLVEPEIPDGA